MRGVDAGTAAGRFLVGAGARLSDEVKVRSWEWVALGQGVAGGGLRGLWLAARAGRIEALRAADVAAL